VDVQINWLAVILATASSMIVGMIWYAKSVFGEKWAKLAKLNLNDKEMAKGAPQAIGITIIVSFITAYVLAHVSYLSNSFFHHSFLQDAVTTAFWLWLGFTAARVITHDVFERRPAALTVMTIGHELVTLLVMGLIIGWLHP
jgi:hypothetical protein